MAVFTDEQQRTGVCKFTQIPFKGMNWHKKANYPLTFLSAWAERYITSSTFCRNEEAFLYLLVLNVVESSFLKQMIIPLTYLKAKKSHPILKSLNFCLPMLVRKEIKLLMNMNLNLGCVIFLYTKNT